MKRGALLSVLPIFLLIMWLLLNDTLAPGQIVLGVVLAICVTLVTTSMRPLRARLRRPRIAIGLFLRVLADIVRSNIAVAGVILGPAARRSNAGFMRIPLDLRDPHGLAVLAAIITSTPGTVWADLSLDGSVLTIHVLDLRDEQAWVRTIKQRYERPLMEIFE